MAEYAQESNGNVVEDRMAKDAQESTGNVVEDRMAKDAQARQRTVKSLMHRVFVAEPMGDKEVEELSGIGVVLGGRLKEKGFDKAYLVFGKFLTLKKNEEDFGAWIKEASGANVKQASDCFKCLREWSAAHL